MINCLYLLTFLEGVYVNTETLPVTPEAPTEAQTVCISVGASVLDWKKDKSGSCPIRCLCLPATCASDVASLRKSYISVLPNYLWELQ